jgi:hypothetical protein
MYSSYLLLSSRRLPTAPDNIYRSTSASTARRPWQGSDLPSPHRSIHPIRIDEYQNDVHGSSPTSSISTRPAGALAPGIPGYDSRYDAHSEIIGNDVGFAGSLYTNGQASFYANGVPSNVTSTLNSRNQATPPRNSSDDARTMTTAPPTASSSQSICESDSRFS